MAQKVTVPITHMAPSADVRKMNKQLEEEEEIASLPSDSNTAVLRVWSSGGSLKCHHGSALCQPGWALDRGSTTF